MVRTCVAFLFTLVSAVGDDSPERSTDSACVRPRGQRVCCWAPCGQEILIDSCGRRATGAGAQQQMRVASCWEPTEEARHRLVGIAAVWYKPTECRIALHHALRTFGELFRQCYTTRWNACVQIEQYACANYCSISCAEHHSLSTCLLYTSPSPRD